MTDSPLKSLGLHHDMMESWCEVLSIVQVIRRLQSFTLFSREFSTELEEGPSAVDCCHSLLTAFVEVELGET